MKICTLSKVPPPVFVNTHKISENLTHGFHLQSNFTDELFGYVGFQEKFNWPPMKSSKTKASFRKVYSLPLTLRSRELWPQTYSLSLPLKWNQVTHTPAGITMGVAYKPEKLPFSNFARQL